MASKKNTEKQAVATTEEAPVIAVATAEAEAPEEVTEAPVENLKKERGYSQSAIDKADLVRLNALKSLIKDKLSMSISNQRILSKALDCLGDQVEGFLSELVAEANEKAKAKDLKQLSELKAKLGME